MYSRARVQRLQTTTRILLLQSLVFLVKVGLLLEYYFGDSFIIIFPIGERERTTDITRGCL